MLDSRNIWICRPDDAHFIHKNATTIKNGRWIYFGRQAEKYFQLAPDLNTVGQSINSGELINEVARDIWEEFVNLDASLSADTIRSEAWQASAVAENNPYMSDFFYQCCAVLAVDRICGDHDGDIFILCEDDDLLIFLAESLEHVQGTRIRLPSPMSWLKVCRSLRESGRYITSRLMFLFRSVKRKGLLCVARWRMKKRIPLNTGSQDLFVIWGTQRTFARGKRLERDGYFGDLTGSFYKTGRSLVYLVLPVEWVDPL